MHAYDAHKYNNQITENTDDTCRKKDAQIRRYSNNPFQMHGVSMQLKKAKKLGLPQDKAKDSHLSRALRNLDVAAVPSLILNSIPRGVMKMTSLGKGKAQSRLRLLW